MEQPTDITREQCELHRYITMYAIDVVTESLASLYKIYGWTRLRGMDVLAVAYTPLEEYFNRVASQLYTREDEYVNSRFDEMLAVKVGPEYDPIDLLSNIVMLTLALLSDMSISKLVTEDYHTTMIAIRTHLVHLARKHEGSAAGLTGCSPDHVHEPIAPGERVYRLKLTPVGADTTYTTL